MQTEPRAHDLVFYDGDCGLCHGAVEFLLLRDPEGRHFRFAALGSRTFTATLSKEARDALPDSLVVVDPEGNVYVKSRAARRALDRVGGPWRVQSWLMWLLPAFVSDAAYDAVAAMRRRLFPKPEGVCPVVPKALRSRFLP